MTLLRYFTIDALEVQQVAAIVHLIELQTHLHKIACHWILSSHAQVVRVHNLQQRYFAFKKMLN